LQNTSLISEVLAASAILASQVTKCCREAARIPIHPRSHTMRRQTLGVPITTRQHIHHHKCWQAVIGIPIACADRPSTEAHKTYRHTSASRYARSYSHFPPAILSNTFPEEPNKNTKQEAHKEIHQDNIAKQFLKTRKKSVYTLLKTFNNVYCDRGHNKGRGTQPYNHGQERQSGKRKLGNAGETNTEWEETGLIVELRVGYK
jgi:hypothetical protein